MRRMVFGVGGKGPLNKVGAPHKIFRKYFVLTSETIIAWILSGGGEIDEA